MAKEKKTQTETLRPLARGLDNAIQRAEIPPPVRRRRMALSNSHSHASNAHAAAAHTAAAHAAAPHAAAHAATPHPATLPDAHATHAARAAGEARALVLLAHAVDVGPEALLEPADLAEDLLAAQHFLLAVGRCGSVRELIDEDAGGVDELGEGGRGPVRDQGLVERHDVRVGRGRAEGVAEVGGVEPGGPVALRGSFSWVGG